MTNPAKYYKNNFSHTRKLLDAMVHHGVMCFVFSSTAAIFGDPEYVSIDEEHPVKPVNPYGKSKLMAEMAPEDYDRAYWIKSVCLRYFNAAGADPEGEVGEWHDPQTHLIPLEVQTALGYRDSLKIFGDDYDTSDGTCVRDYIQVSDLCDAHVRALQNLFEGGSSARYNLGNGTGYSVREIIDSVKRVSARGLQGENTSRRQGDPSQLISDSRLAFNDLGWNPEINELDTIVSHTIKWEKNIENCARLRKV